MTAQYEIIIVGGGIAGLSAALFAKRAGWRVVVVEKMVAGGQLNLAPRLQNYPGIPEITGSDLADQIYAQATAVGVEFIFAPAQKIDCATKTVVLADRVLQGAVLILATGLTTPKLTFPNADLWQNNGIYYCATCDGPLYRDQIVVVYGTGQEVVTDALYLAGVCARVILVHPGESLPLQTALDTTKNLTVIKQSNVVAVGGTQQLNSVTWENEITHQREEITAAALFINVGGSVANLHNVTPKPQCNPDGYVVTDANCATNLPGVYAVGDLREKICRQAITAAADGATAATAAGQYLRQRKARP